MSEPLNKMPLASVKRSLELGATFIENDLARIRAAAIGHDAQCTPSGEVLTITHCLEHDLMQVADWASAAATLRALAKLEPRS